jgi:hypothetical protein
MVSLNWGEIFSRAVSTGVKEFSDVAKAKDVSVKAEAKASAEAFAEANEKYKNEVEQNKITLKKEVESISDLVGGDLNKIRTVMKTYGNAEVVSQLQKDYERYQSDALYDQKSIKFKTLKEYINGKLTPTGTGLVSDEAAEQATDEAAVVGDELDIQKAEQKAKGMGITLEQYLNTQARKLSSRPAFSVEGKAARLVEESKMGLFGKTLTMEEARKMVTGGQKLGGEEAEDLGDTGFALAREGGLSGETRFKIQSNIEDIKEREGKIYSNAEYSAVRSSIAKELKGSGLEKLVDYDGLNTYVLKDTDEAKKAALSIIEKRLREPKEGEARLDKKSIAILNKIKNDLQGEPKKTIKDAIEEIKANPELIKDFIKQFGKDKVPPELQKLIPKDDNTIKIEEKDTEKRVIDSEGNAPPKPPSSLLTTPSEKKARDEWDKLYGDDYYPNGKPKPKKV